MPADLARRYDASDFGTPVTDFDVTNSSHGSRIAIDASGEYDQLAYQSNNEYVIELQPLKKGQAETQRPKYTGERLTLNFQDISVRAVLQLLMDASGKNIVVSDTVSGNVTLRLQNVPWDQALAIILQTKGLGQGRGGQRDPRRAAGGARRAREGGPGGAGLGAAARAAALGVPADQLRQGGRSRRSHQGAEQLAAVQARQRRR